MQRLSTCLTNLSLDFLRCITKRVACSYGVWSGKAVYIRVRCLRFVMSETMIA